ncbi:laccase domain-containing protein [candidate division WS5 bacterium]|uniref:Laccase domain-containing protein n=1 Tax=candidate division WS5 bacterium TaxID=2093353 RepID=A0A419DEN8_9BACT|nr:MAG: laccase domain-containing protein [candidate division WS5 bacterium]
MKNPMKLFEDKVEFGFSDNSDGNLAFRFGDIDDVNQKRRIFFKKEGIDPETSVVMLPEHASNAVEVTKRDSGKGVYKLDDAIRCDCIYTRDKNLNLLVTVADCIALAIYDSANEQLAMAHIGVKNLSIGTVGEVLRVLKENSDNEADFSAITGPFIKKCCYGFDKIPEYLKNLENYFIPSSCHPERQPKDPLKIRERDSSARRATKSARLPDGQVGMTECYYFDTESVLRDQLVEAGVKKENISTSGLCSMHNDFPSYRRSLKENLPESRMLVYARMI